MSIQQIKVVNFNSPDGFYVYEATNSDNKMLANIVYDSDDLTQQWVVFVNDVEVHRTNTTMRAQNYVIWHYNRNTLPEWEENVCKNINDSELIEEPKPEKLFHHVKKSLVHFTLGLIIFTTATTPALSYELPTKSRTGIPVITKKPEKPPTPSRVDDIEVISTIDVVKKETEPSKPHRGSGRR